MRTLKLLVDTGRVFHEPGGSVINTRAGWIAGEEQSFAAQAAVFSPAALLCCQWKEIGGGSSVIIRSD